MSRVNYFGNERQDKAVLCGASTYGGKPAVGDWRRVPRVEATAAPRAPRKERERERERISRMI